MVGCFRGSGGGVDVIVDTDTGDASIFWAVEAAVTFPH